MQDQFNFIGNVSPSIESLREQSLLLLFDEVNEAPREVVAAMQQFLGRFEAAKIPIICITRQLGAGADLDIRTQLTMLPLNEAQMQDLVRQRLPHRGDELLRFAIKASRCSH